jgi:hypothetical protein
LKTTLAAKPLVGGLRHEPAGTVMHRQQFLETLAHRGILAAAGHELCRALLSGQLRQHLEESFFAQVWLVHKI